MDFSRLLTILFLLLPTGLAAIASPSSDLKLFSARDGNELNFADEREAAQTTASDKVAMDLTERSIAGTTLREGVDSIQSETRSAGPPPIFGSLKKVFGDFVRIKKSLDKFGKNQRPTKKEALGISTTTSKAQRALKNGTKLAKRMDPLSTNDQTKVCAYLKQKVTPAIIAAVQDFVRHRSGLGKGGFGGAVRSRLEQLKKETEAYYKAILQKTTVSICRIQIENEMQQLKREFNKAITAYST